MSAVKNTPVKQGKQAKEDTKNAPVSRKQKEVESDATSNSQEHDEGIEDSDASNDNTESEVSSDDIDEAESLVAKADEEASDDTSGVEDTEEDEDTESGTEEESEASVEKKAPIKKQIETPREGDDSLSVFVKGFSNDVSESALKNELSKYGTVTNVRMPKDKKTGSGKGFAYIEFASKEEVAKVMKQLKSVLGSDVVVDTPRPRVSRDSVFTVFVKNLPYECTEESIKKYFSKFGNVINVRLPKDAGRSKGFCFIEVVEKDVYDTILSSSHVFDNRKLVVDECTKSRDNSNNNARGGSRGNDRDSNKPYGRDNRRSQDESDDNDNSNKKFRGNNRPYRNEGNDTGRNNFRGRKPENGDGDEKPRRFNRDGNNGKNDRNRKGQDGRKVVFDEESD